MASDMGSHKDLYGFLKFLKSCLKFYRRKKNPFFPIILEGLEKQMDQFLFLQNVKNTKQIFTVCLPYSFLVGFHEDQKQDRVQPSLGIQADNIHTWVGGMSNI